MGIKSLNTLPMEYETGTSNIALTFGGASVGITYTGATLYYAKIGNMVVFNAYVALSAVGSSTGNAEIIGLPYSCVSTQTASAAVGGYSYFSSVTSITARIPAGTSVIRLYNAASGSVTQLTSSNFTAASTIWIGGTYMTL